MKLDYRDAARLAWMGDFQNEFGFPPSREAIRHKFGWTPQGADMWVRRMQGEGWLDGKLRVKEKSL